MRITSCSVAALLTLSIGCATQTPAPEIPLSGTVDVDGKNLYFPAATVANSDLAPLRKTVETRCDGPCDRVFLAVTEDTAPSVLEKFMDASMGHAHRPDVHAVPPSGEPIPLVGAQDCTKKIFIEQKAGYVEIDGNAERPDATCDMWDATICKNENGYDWPRLASVVGDADHVCVSLGDDATVTELLKIIETLRNPDISILDEGRNTTAVVSEEDMQAFVTSQQDETDWCFGQVVNPDKPNDVKAKIAVDWTGKVVRTNVWGNRTTPQFEKCILEVLGKLDFDVPESAGTSVGQVSIVWTEAEVAAEEETAQ